MVATANRRDRYRFPPVWLGLAVAVVVLAFLSAALIFRVSSRSHSARAGSLQAPTGLRARQVSAAEVRFSWRGIPHATAYLVDVGLDQFYTRVPSLMVSGVLEPGKQYTWWVEGQLQDRQGPRSERVSLRLRPLPARSWRFYPSPLPVDHVLVTLYNPNTSASEARLQVKNALATRTQVRLPPLSGAEIGVLPPKAGNIGLALTVKASAPIMAQRLVIRSHSTQSAYGIPEPDTGST